MNICGLIPVPSVADPSETNLLGPKTLLECCQCAQEFLDEYDLNDGYDKGTLYLTRVYGHRTRMLTHFQSLQAAAERIEADVAVEPLTLQADATKLDFEMHAYERSLAVTPGGTPEVVPTWQDTHAMHTDTCVFPLGNWIRTDLGLRTFQGLGKNSPARDVAQGGITMRDSATAGLGDQPPAPPRTLEQIPLQELYRPVPE